MKSLFRKSSDLFSSKLGFILSTAGSAIGLANIWKFPYVVGMFGGGAFLLTYLVFLVLIGFPAFFSEILIGKSTEERPDRAFHTLGKKKLWGWLGLGTIWTGFLVSSFYSVVAGWVLGYFYEALMGNLSPLTNMSLTQEYYRSLIENPVWTSFFHLVFTLVCAFFLLGGIRGGIEKCNRIFMPIFFVVLLAIVIWSASTPSASEVLRFMTTVDFSKLTPYAIIVALGHAFFTLSVGQGTLVTYGSYLKRDMTIIPSSLFIVGTDTMVSILAAFSIVSIVFSAGVDITFGPGLIFETLPSIFAEMPLGNLFCVLFFFLVFIAAMTSQVSALEPMIAHLVESRGWNRKPAVLTTLGSSYLLGLPSLLSTNIFSHVTISGSNFLEGMNFLCTSIFIPIGALAAVLLAGRKMRFHILAESLAGNEKSVLEKSRYFAPYLRLTIGYIAPLLIILILLHGLGII